jgi:hypothetical protein
MRAPPGDWRTAGWHARNRRVPAVPPDGTPEVLRQASEETGERRVLEMRPILLLLALVAPVWGGGLQLAPDGTYVHGTPHLAPDGTYVGGGLPQLAPDGTYVGGTPRLAPDGSYTGGSPRIAPDGSYTGGQPQLAPDGTYVGDDDD